MPIVISVAKSIIYFLPPPRCHHTVFSVNAGHSATALTSTMYPGEVALGRYGVYAVLLGIE